MNIKLSQQISATYARNHFKEVNNRAIKEDMVVIMRKSAPVTVILSIDEYEHLIIKNKAWQNKISPKIKKKITLKELRKKSKFEKFKGCLAHQFKGKTAIEIAKNWTDYVD